MCANVHLSFTEKVACKINRVLLFRASPQTPGVIEIKHNYFCCTFATVFFFYFPFLKQRLPKFHSIDAAVNNFGQNFADVVQALADESVLSLWQICIYIWKWSQTLNSALT